MLNNCNVIIDEMGSSGLLDHYHVDRFDMTLTDDIDIRIEWLDDQLNDIQRSFISGAIV